MLFNGEFEVSAYIGSEEILEAWFGESKVYPNAFLEVSVSSLSFVAAGESKTFHIESTDGLEWTITGLPSGWSASALSGNIPGDVTITAPNNTTNSSIKGTLTITLEGITATVSLTQSAGTITTEYSDWVTNALAGTVSGTIPAAGGTATLSASADQSRVKTTKWNGIVTNTETENQTIDVSASAAYSKVSGSGSVSGRTVTFPNNTTSQTATGVYRASYDSKTADITVTQSAGTMTTEYSDWVTVKIYASYSPWGAVAAAGGTVSLTFTEEQNQTVTTKWNGIVTNTETNEREIGGVITQATCYKVSGSGTLTGSSVTFTNNTSTDELSGTYRITYNGLTSDVTITQNAGTKVYGAWQNVRLETEGDITSFAASGGTAKIHMVIRRDWTWNGVAGSGGTETNWSQPADVTVSDTIASVSADVLTVGSLGTTFKAATQILIGAGTASDTISTHRKTLAITQAANYVVKIEGIGSRNTLSYSQAPAGGGTSSPTWTGDTDAVMDTKVRTTFSSGATAGWSAAKAGGTWSIDRMPYSWSGASGNFTALNASTGAVTVSSKGTTVSGVTNGPVVTCNIYYKFTHNATYGGAAVVAVSAVPGTATPTQAANAVTGYGTPTGRTLSVGDIPASGGTISSGTLGGTITQSRTFTSGASDTLTNPTVSSSSYSTAISGSNLGSTVTSRTAKGTLTHYYTCNGKQGSCSATVYQAANTWYDHDIVLSANSTSIGAGGGSVTLTSTVYRMYASGTRAVGGSGYGTLSGSASGFTVSGWTVSAASRGTTEGGARSISVTSKYAGLTSNVVTITQAANSVAGYTLSRLSANGSTIPYGGGTLAVTVRTYAYPRYSSGSTGATDTLADLGQPSDTIGVSWLTRQNMTKSGTGTYAFYYSAPQNSGTGDRTGNLTFSLSGKSTSLTVRQSGIPTYSLRIGAMTQSSWNLVMGFLKGFNVAYNTTTPVSGSAGDIKMISLIDGVGAMPMVSWQGEGLQYFRIYSRSAVPSNLVIKVMPSTQSGKILSGATTQRGTPVNLQGQVDANTTIVLGIYIEGEA